MIFYFLLCDTLRGGRIKQKVGAHTRIQFRLDCLRRRDSVKVNYFHLQKLGRRWVTFFGQKPSFKREHMSIHGIAWRAHLRNSQSDPHSASEEGTQMGRPKMVGHDKSSSNRPTDLCCARPSKKCCNTRVVGAMSDVTAKRALAGTEFYVIADWASRFDVFVEFINLHAVLLLDFVFYIVGERSCHSDHSLMEDGQMLEKSDGLLYRYDIRNDDTKVEWFLSVENAAGSTKKECSCGTR